MYVYSYRLHRYSLGMATTGHLFAARGMHKKSKREREKEKEENGARKEEEANNYWLQT